MLTEWNEQSMKMIALTVIAGIGGALSYMWRETKAGRQIRLFRVALSACLVAFICFHLGLVYEEFGLNQQTIWALNGFTSVIGVEALMSLVAKLTFKFMRMDEDDIVNQRLIDSGWTPPNSGTSTGLGQAPQTEPAAAATTEGSK